ncbi:hypothetical protein AB1Y20_013074 [Prymnesium parvum]|uniref:Oxidoreductase FAD/NAD(P)-binding domain-containing protein n=1 Tax=Prymnesium parvum TaxID=97485 RepID=A0AB34IMJ9_PRYPA
MLLFALATRGPSAGAPPARAALHMAAPPQIDWQAAEVVLNTPIARGTMQLRLKTAQAHRYKPGHIFGFEMEHPESGEALKGPYTVTRAVGADMFDVVYRVIPSGRKTPLMAQLGAGAHVRYGGSFGTPIDEGIAPECDRVVGLATGAGIGPLVGYAEAALASARAPLEIELYCGFRELADVCHEACDALVAKYPDRFRWKPVISQPVTCSAAKLSGFGSELSSGVGSTAVETGYLQGRVSIAVPPLLGVVDEKTHFHLVGNGQFVADLQEGLLRAGVDAARVTTEKYFNGKAVPNEDVAQYVASSLKARAGNIT